VDTHADVVRRFYACWNAEDLGGVLESFDAGAEFRPVLVPLLTREIYRGHDAIAQWFTELRERWAEFKVDVERVDELGDGVVAFIRLVATDDAGEQLDARIANLFTFRDGRIAVMEGRDAGETLEELEAL
jgi:ketosteroid isomerase-like protein